MKTIYFKKKLSKIKRSARVVECIHPEKAKCEGKVIRAHSIQNNKILNHLSEKGYVMQIDAEETPFTGNLSKIGRKIATTFTGFCSKHDNLTFKPIEEKYFTPKDKEQEFLYAYRAFAREFIAKKFHLNTIKILVKNKNHPYYNYFKQLLIGAQQSIKDLENFKERFNTCLLKNNFNDILTKIIILNKNYSIAVSSMFHIEYDFNGKKINYLEDLTKLPKPLFLTIFPEKEKTYVLFSFFNDNYKTFRFLDEQILKCNKSKQIERFNLIIALYCENFVYSPTKWKNIKKWQKENFVKLFFNTMGDKDYNELQKKPKFNLFI